MEELLRISEELKTQDNQGTSHPIFMVQTMEVQHGFNPDYSSKVVWFSDVDFCEASEEEETELYAEYTKTHEEPEGWILTGKLETWVNLQPFFTNKGAEEFIKENFYKYEKLRVYVDSGHRNKEWQIIRNYLKELS